MVNRESFKPVGTTVSSQKFHQKKLIQKNPEQFPKKMDENIRLIPGSRDPGILKNPVLSCPEMKLHLSSSLPTPQKRRNICVKQNPSMMEYFFAPLPFYLGLNFRFDIIHCSVNSSIFTQPLFPRFGTFSLFQKKVLCENQKKIP